jgi:glycosyltransferase involved in cell wall biosynthesis
MKPLAIVVPWFGAEQTGGAEQQAFQIATRLAARGHEIEVLSTTNRSFHSDWSSNHYPAGLSQADGLTIRRFPVDTRDAVKFDQVNAKLLSLDPRELRAGVAPLTPAETDTFVQQNIKSEALLNYLRAEGHSYHAFLFLPYMFAPVMLGLPIVAERAWLQPCLHDEPQAYLFETAALFRSAHGLLFNSEGELELALRLYGPGILSRSTVVGEGVELTECSDSTLPDDLRGARFVMYLGRRDRVKNVDLLVAAFHAFKSLNPESTLRLVLAGPGSKSFASAAGIHDLALVSAEVKAALLANCRALAQPSRNESFSRAMMEAWRAGKPVVANGDCLATSLAVMKSGGGWTATSQAEWIEVFSQIDQATDDLLHSLGEQGKRYAQTNSDWESVIARYEVLFSLVTQPVERAAPVEPQPRSIHQLLPDIVYGDAISNQARAIRDRLRQAGYSSEIFVKRRDKRMATEALLFDETQPNPEDGLIYHHAIGSDLTDFAVKHEGPKGLVYHNITPAKYFYPYRPGFAWLLEVGRKSLKHLADHFAVSVGDSAYNAAELAACGFNVPGVVPIIIDPHKWNIAPDELLMDRLQDRQTNILFVGRVAPNKRQDRLIEAFSHYRKLDPESRLIIAGETKDSDPYFHHLLETRRRFDLERVVEITGQISEAQLLAYYRTAHLYWSASEHEGFGAPLVEAMWFDVPVLALSATTVPETLGDTRMLYSDAEDLQQVAARAFQLTHDAGVRGTIIEAQRRRRGDFLPNAVWPILEQFIQRLVVESEPALRS